MAKNKIILGLIILLAAALRLWQIGVIPPGLFGDEVDTGYQAYSILKTGKDYFGNWFPVHFQSFGDWRVPLYIYIDTFFVAILGLTELAVRLPAAIFGIISVLLSYFLAKKLTNNEKVALGASFLLAISPWHIQLSRIGVEAILLTVLYPLALILFWKGIEKQKNLFFVSSAFLFGLSVYAYNTPKLFTPLILIVLFVLWWKQLLANKKKTFFFILALIVILLPLGFDFVKGTGQARFLGVSIFADPDVAEKVRLARQTCDCQGLMAKLLHNKITVWSDTFTKNYLSAFSTDFLFAQGDPNPRHAVGGRGELYLFELPFLILGLLLAFWEAWKKSKFWQFALLWLILAPAPAALTLNGGTHAIRLFLFLPWMSILTAFGMIAFFDNLRGQKLRWVLPPLLTLIISLSLFLYVHEYFVHYPKQSGRWWNYGYREIFDYVNKVEDKYSKINVSPSWEPSIVYTLFYSQYPPSKVQEEITISAVDIGKYHFLSPDIGRLKRGQGDAKTLYVLNPAELEIAGLKLEDSPSLIFIKSIKAPDGSDSFVIFSSSDVGKLE